MTEWISVFGNEGERRSENDGLCFAAERSFLYSCACIL